MVPMSGTYKVEGMTCQGCVRSLTSAIQAVKPDEEPTIDLDAGTLAVVGIDEATVL